MRTLAKVGIVGAGYLGAFALAAAVVTAYIAATSGPDRQADAMFSFGDDLLFLAVFGVASVVPSGAALFFLRPYRSFWRMLSLAAVILATTGAAAFLDNLVLRVSDGGPVGNPWSPLAWLRILLAPFFVLALLPSAVMAPSRNPRLALLVATAIEVSVCVYLAFLLFGHHR